MLDEDSSVNSLERVSKTLTQENFKSLLQQPVKPTRLGHFLQYRMNVNVSTTNIEYI